MAAPKDIGTEKDVLKLGTPADKPGLSWNGVYRRYAHRRGSWQPVQNYTYTLSTALHAEALLFGSGAAGAEPGGRCATDATLPARVESGRGGACLETP